VKDPASGRRVSRLNPPEAWIVEAVPDLRIIDNELWEAVQARQAEIDAEPGVQAMKSRRFWERRRAVHMLTGRVFCGACGGTLAAAGRDYLACSNARKLGTCRERKAIRRPDLEGYVLDLVRDRLMEPNAVKAFVSAYHYGINAGRDAAAAERLLHEAKLVERQAKLQGLYDAVADGLRTPGLLAQLEALETEVACLQAAASAPAPSAVRLHPGLADNYRRKVTALGEALKDAGQRDPAVSGLRDLIARVEVRHDGGGWMVELQGELEALVALGLAKEKAPRPRLSAEALCSAKVVAGVGGNGGAKVCHGSGVMVALRAA
jgi:site-specific DNA recombinase